MLRTASVFGSLSASTRAERLGALDLGMGKASAIWRNSHDRMRYEKPDGHTFSCYLQGGNGTRRVDGTSLAGWPGALCIMPQGASSEWEITESFEFVHLYVANNELRRLFSETFDRDARMMVLPETTFDTAPQLAECLGKLAFATQTGDHLLGEQASIFAIQHLFTDPRYGGETRPVLHGGLVPLIRHRLIDYIEAELHTQISLRDLARIAGLSEFHLQRMFKQSCGVSPYGFILSRRIDRARNMLAGSEPIAQIAMDCGFSSQSHMTRLFKSVTGTTPSAYRRMVSKFREHESIHT